MSKVAISFLISSNLRRQPTKGRLAIPAEALVQAKKKTATAVEIERSELEIDFMETIQPKTSADSAFELDPMAKIETFTKPTRFRTKALGSGSSESVFDE